MRPMVGLLDWVIRLPVYLMMAQGLSLQSFAAVLAVWYGWHADLLYQVHGFDGN